MNYNLPIEALVRDEACDTLVAALSSGGDERIALTAENGLNKYYSAPYPRSVIAYSSSTVSDISPDAFAHLLSVWTSHETMNYKELLQNLRKRLSAAYALPDTTNIVFAASGTDLEYVSLAGVHNRASGGVHNILLGADEIGSGCIHSARGQYFAKQTALGIASEVKEEVAGCGNISLVDVPVRCPMGKACSSEQITDAFAREISLAIAEDKHALVHVVHGSKTGLVLPELRDLDDLQARFGDNATFVIDACQARITSPAIAEYLERGCIVLMTGSKFMGAPPFNGFALIPESIAATAGRLPAGFSRIFNRAEFASGWPGADLLSEGENRSLALRLEAAIFELERFQEIPLALIHTMIAAFENALECELIKPLGIKRVIPNRDKDISTPDRPIEMRTLATLDVSMLPGTATFDDAQALHRTMALQGIRLGQPVKSVRQDGVWGGTLRVGLSMPMMSAWASMTPGELNQRLASDLGAVADMIRERTLQNA